MNRESPAHHAPAVVVCSDEEIQREIGARLKQAADLDSRHVTVEVQACLVTLSGTVKDVHTRQAVEQLAQNCPGVQDVENHLRVQAS